ncbi:hypothetical protein FBU30_002900 [Linnemannia zychae]|nr:hypothetical protein FBU30_002900 [Linnemannia zychae]
MLYRVFTIFIVATLFLAQFGLAASGDLVISGHHYRNPKGCYVVVSDPALIINDTPVSATGYSDAECKGSTTHIPAGFRGKLPGLKSINIE